MIKKIFIGIVIVAIGLGVAYSIVVFPFEKPIIYYSLRTTKGLLVSTSEDVETGERGTIWFYKYTFTYSANEKTFTRSIQQEGKLKPKFKDISDPIPITVLYSSVFPSFAQIEDEGEVTFEGYVIRGILLTFFAYGIVIWLSVFYFKNLKEKSRGQTLTLDRMVSD